MTKRTGCAGKANAALLALAGEFRKIKAGGCNSAKFQPLARTEQRAVLTVRGLRLCDSQGQGQPGQGSEHPGHRGRCPCPRHLRLE